MDKFKASPMVKKADYIPDPEKKKYSELQVLRSAAGFFIGTIYTGDDGFQEPGSRDSEYFPTREAAQKALDTRNWEQRETP